MAGRVSIADLELLDAVRGFALRHPHRDVARFADAMRDWGEDWIAVEAEYLPAAEFLDRALERATGANRELLEVFARHARELRWEQSYRKADRLVPQAMLDGYAFTEIIGQRGPFVSRRVRAGIGVWGPGIDYPRHHHAAEETYALLAGSAEFRVGDAPPATCRAEEVVYVAPHTPHGFRTGDEILVVYYLWQAGDLRQTSIFA